MIKFFLFTYVDNVAEDLSSLEILAFFPLKLKTIANRSENDIRVYLNYPYRKYLEFDLDLVSSVKAEAFQ